MRYLGQVEPVEVVHSFENGAAYGGGTFTAVLVASRATDRPIFVLVSLIVFFIFFHVLRLRSVANVDVSH